MFVVRQLACVVHGMCLHLSVHASRLLHRMGSDCDRSQTPIQLLWTRRLGTINTSLPVLNVPGKYTYVATVRTLFSDCKFSLF